MPALRILIVEDEPLIALEAEAIVTSHLPAGDVHVANDLAAASSLIADSAFDVAVLDLNLNGQSSVPLAERLASQGVGLVITTGYHDGRLLKTRLGATVIEKPYDDAELISAITTVRGV